MQSGRSISFLVLGVLIACGGEVSDDVGARTSEALVDPAAAVAARCAGQTRNEGQCVSCITRVLGELRRDGAISGPQHGALLGELSARGCGCVEGAMTCEGTGFLTCADGAWVYRDCAPGTACQATGSGIVCDWPN